jgi:hypothetical protein
MVATRWKSLIHMKILLKEDLCKVAPKFRNMVIEAWARGEDVPYAVTHLSDAPLTERDIERGHQLIKQYGWDVHES